ncbi:MAG: HD domain-containing protein [Proteobacteria bacterium]|nr:HD domain-containing protein [Pseudomonadota bacterium]
MVKDNLKITRDIHSINGKLLVSKNDQVDTDRIEEISKEVIVTSRVWVKLKESFLFNDFYLQTQSPPYNFFCKKCGEQLILNIFGSVAVPVSILEEYHFMRIKDDYTYRHSINSALLTICMATQFYEDRQKINQIASSSITHDLGKSRIPSNILHSSQPLTEKDYSLIKEHTIYGAVLCSYYYGNPYSENTIVALQHHEKLNGKGYPLSIRLKDDVVSFVAVADIFDALISKRPYRNEPYDVRGAIDILCQSVERGEIDEKYIKMMIHLNRREPESLLKISYSKVYRGYYPRINYYGIRREIYCS